jgi:hypothetical protein
LYNHLLEERRDAYDARAGKGISMLYAQINRSGELKEATPALSPLHGRGE